MKIQEVGKETSIAVRILDLQDVMPFYPDSSYPLSYSHNTTPPFPPYFLATYDALLRHCNHIRRYGAVVVVMLPLELT